ERRRSGHEIAQPVASLTFAQAEEGTIAELTDPLPGDAHHPSDLLQRPAVAIVQPEIEPEHLGIPRRKRGQGSLDVPGLAVGHGGHVRAFLLPAGEALDPLVALAVPGGMVEP